jgi:hypothetical protein
MMDFNIGDKVMVNCRDGISRFGTISCVQHSVSIGGTPLVEYGLFFDGMVGLQFYSLHDLDYMAGAPTPVSYCDCGADKTYYPIPAPGHAQWCDSQKFTDWLDGQGD